jgi:hypothetical protein
MMQWPDQARSIAERILALDPTLILTSDDTRRLLMLRIAEQLAYSLDPRYGVKATTASNPQGQSTIAFNSQDGLGGWRIVDGDGKATGTVNSLIPNPPWQPFAGQYFIPVHPTDHLSAPVPEPAPAPSPTQVPEPSPPAELPAILKALTDLTGAVQALDANVLALAAKVSALQQSGLKLRF